MLKQKKARVKVEASRGSEENKRVDAENLRKQAETARVNAETLRNQSETARAESEKARASAETARKQAEQSRLIQKTVLLCRLQVAKMGHLALQVLVMLSILMAPRVELVSSFRLGGLGFGSVAGLAFCGGGGWLGGAGWNILARQSDLIFFKTFRSRT